MSNVQWTSVKAYREAVERGSIRARQAEVFRLLDVAPMTDLQLSEAMAVPINVVPAARGALVKLGFVEKAGLTTNATGATAMLWRVKK